MLNKIKINVFQETILNVFKINRIAQKESNIEEKYELRTLTAQYAE